MKALVTGGDGFVGEHLVAHLVAAGHRVTASCLSLPPNRDTLTAELAAAMEWKVADVLDGDALYRVVAAARPDRIYHLAGFSSGGTARRRPEEALRVNAGGTVNLLEAILRAGEDFPGLAPVVLILGSGDAYGESALSGEPVAETAPLRPRGPYGLSKACQEMAGDAYRRGAGVRTIVARAFNMLGPGQRRGFVLPDFCAQAAAIAAGKAEPVLRVGNLDVERDFVDVRDAVAAIERVAGLEEGEGGEPGVYNVCSGVATAVGTLLDWVLDAADIEVEVRVEQDRVREGEPSRLVGDPGRIRRTADWSPARDLRETVRETYRWVAGSRERRSEAGGSGT